MKMRFAQCAIVKFYFNCEAKGLCDTGRIKSVTEDEVVIIPQVAIVQSIGYKLEKYPENPEVEHFLKAKTLDDGREVHIDRNIIIGWEYYRHDSNCIHKNYTTEREIKDQNKMLTKYSDEGYFKGYGKNLEE